MEEGAPWLALLAAGLLFGGLALETRLLMRHRTDSYFLVSMPLGADLVPIPRAPTGSARTESVQWEVETPNVVRWWSRAGARTAPLGLHGVVLLRESRRGVVLEVRWAPPITLFLAALWLALLGVARGDGGITVPLALTLGLLAGAWYQHGARKAARELRWSFLACQKPPDGV